MKKYQHTKGKWEFDGDLLMNGEIIASAANLCPAKATYDEAIANCRLIAAAPDMLKLLTEYLNYNGDYIASMPSGDWVARVSAVVAKAKGK